MNIFIGSSSEAADNDILLKVAAILRSAGAAPVLWNGTPSVFKAGKTTIETLEEMIKNESINAAVFIYTGDDKTWYRGDLQNVPRDNIVFEHGLFTGMLGREKAIAVKFGNVRMPSDLLGVTCIDFSKNPEDAAMNIKGWVKGLPRIKQLNAAPSQPSPFPQKQGSVYRGRGMTTEEVIEKALGLKPGTVQAAKTASLYRTP
jgi:predicted nucleotide-binding protein